MITVYPLDIAIICDVNNWHHTIWCNFKSVKSATLCYRFAKRWWSDTDVRRVYVHIVIRKY